jgi:hypothetical protein
MDFKTALLLVVAGTVINPIVGFIVLIIVTIYQAKND